MKKIISILMALLLSSVYSNTHTLVDPDTLHLDQTIIMGSIQFPKNLKEVPQIKLYYAGNKIKGSLDHDNKKMVFSLPIDRQHTIFYLLITKKINHHKEDGLIQYLKIKPGQQYLFYRMELATYLTRDEKGTPSKQQKWIISREKVPSNGQIPDYTIITLCDPEYIQTVEDANAHQLPTIKIKEDVLQLVGSEDTLHELSVEQLLSSLDTDLIHASIKSDIKQNHQKTVVAMVTP